MWQKIQIHFQFIYILQIALKFIYFIIKNQMLKTISIRKHSAQIQAIEKIFYNEIDPPQQKYTIIELPFFNFICYTIDLLQQFIKCPYKIPLNLFIVDYHIRKYENVVELYRRFVGYMSSWKKHLQHEQTILLISLLKSGRSDKNNVKLFLKLRKILLKTINEKILQQIHLNHEDAVTIIHTMKIISIDIKKNLTKKINEYFITKNIKYINNIKFNAATLCQFMMQEINDKCLQNQEKVYESVSNVKKMKNRPQSIFQFDQQSIKIKEVSISQDIFQSSKYNQKELQNDKQNGQKGQENVSHKFSHSESYTSDRDIAKSVQHKRSLVNFEKCLKQLNFLKQKDKEIDNRFKKLHQANKDQI